PAQQAKKPAPNAQANRNAAANQTGKKQGGASEVRLAAEDQLRALSDEVFALRGDEPTGIGTGGGKGAGIGGGAPLGTGAGLGTPGVGTGTPGLVTPNPNPNPTPTLAAGPVVPGQEGGEKRDGAKKPLSPEQQARLNEAQRNLSVAYSDIAQRGVEVGGGVEARAMHALDGSEHRPTARIKVAKDDDGAGAGGEGGGGEGLKGKGIEGQGLPGQGLLGQGLPGQGLLPGMDGGAMQVADAGAGPTGGAPEAPINPVDTVA
ncbi:MAG: hypothetical protein AB1758_25690, partial [Candidatus Eremiobacterota bacterium]